MTILITIALVIVIIAYIPTAISNLTKVTNAVRDKANTIVNNKPKPSQEVLDALEDLRQANRAMEENIQRTLDNLKSK